ncbi:MAG TPA: zinc-dependent alcohol dehydrogenase family protein [Gemmataceae bacterium]|nr:zinc-dependent alcohol dehydrogenase family protein [Gemmataceae bacterium]
MKAIVFDQFGDPADVLRVRDVPVPEPERGQVRVRMLASPINPSDLLSVRGQYGRRPALPATPGFEGVGVVDAAGPGLLGRWRLGRRVAVLNSQGGNWQEQVIVSARQVVPIAGDVSDEQAATFFVNPATAFIMTRLVLKVASDAWVLQTAAGSALGRMVIRLGKHFGFRTLNVVRRPEQAEELLQAGGDAVICTKTESIEKRVEELTGGAGVPFALDAVGGDTGSAIVRCLGNRGRLLIYGTLAEEPLSVHPRILIVGQKRIEGFWLSEWARQQRILKMLRLFRQIQGLLAKGILATEIGATFALDDIQAAVRQASLPGHRGKVLLRIASA